MPLYDRVLYKVSGEVLQGAQGFGVDPMARDRIVDDVIAARDLGVQLALVVGGGNFFRGAEMEQGKADRVTSDHMGMLAIVMNALALRMAFEAKGTEAVVLSGLAVPAAVETFTQRGLVEHREANRIIIFAGGTGNPYFTSDTGAALRAAEFGAQAILKGTKVDGVYSADPQRDPDAERYSTLSHTRLLTEGLQIMDAAAVAMARDNDIDIVVFSIRDHSLAAVLRGEQPFTTVHREVKVDTTQPTPEPLSASAAAN